MESREEAGFKNQSPLKYVVAHYAMMTRNTEMRRLAELLTRKTSQEVIYRRSKVCERRPRKPERPDAVESAEEEESLREVFGRVEVQFPAPPLPTW